VEEGKRLLFSQLFRILDVGQQMGKPFFQMDAVQGGGVIHAVGVHRSLIRPASGGQKHAAVSRPYGACMDELPAVAPHPPVEERP
jgi:hypothetical protein